MLCQDTTTGFGHIGRAGKYLGAPGLHHRATIRFLLVADLHHVDADVDTELTSGKSERASPLTGTGFGDQTVNACHFVVIGLGNGGVRFVRTCRADCFVFVVDLGRSLEHLLQSMSAEQG